MTAGVEARLSELHRERALHELATLAISTYGPELYGFLVNTLGALPDAAEVFSQTTEDFWRALPSFRGQCSVRTWLYVLAQHAAQRHRRSPWNRGRRSGESRLGELVAAIRTRTAPWQRTEVKDRWRELRASLAPDDRALLVLRVDRALAWSEVARIMLGDAEREPAAV